MGEETRRLYYEDPYQHEFQANVVRRTVYESRPAVILDQTCFYPESGGQPSDRGTLNDIQVIKVVIEGPSIIHVLDEDIPSDRIKGKIDWARRFDHMQQHGGQHILSQCFSSIHKAKTLSFHLGERISTLEIDLREMSDKDAEKAERLANEIVFENKEIKTYFVDEEDIEKVPLRKPPQKRGRIRVVEISDFDHSACGGTHPRRTGEIGLIKILRQQRIRGNVRMEFVCGSRALQDYSLKDRILRDLLNKLTISETEVVQSFDKLLQDLKTQKKKVRALTERAMKYEAREIVAQGKSRIIHQILSGKTLQEARSLALNIIKAGDYVVLFGLRAGERAHLVLACAESLCVDMRELVSLVAPLLKGKGGGSATLVEIGGEQKENLTVALEKALEHIKKRLL